MCGRATAAVAVLFFTLCGTAPADPPLLFPERQFGTASLSLPQSNALYSSALETLGSRSERFEPLSDKRADDIYRKLGLPIGRLDLLVELGTGDKGVATCTTSLI